MPETKTERLLLYEVTDLYREIGALFPTTAALADHLIDTELVPAIVRHLALMDAVNGLLRALGDDDCDLSGPREEIVEAAIRQTQEALAAERLEPVQ